MITQSGEAPPEAPETATPTELAPFHDAVTDFKAGYLAEAIEQAGGNRAEAARRLGLQRTYLYRLEKQLGLKS